jgi:hypothetical protein
MASKLSEKQLDVLVKTVLGEARGEGIQGMEAVAQVIRNRAMAVALQPKQFSAWNAGEGGNNPQQFKPGTQQYETAKQAIQRVFSGEAVDPTNGALFYHTPQVNPGWSKDVNKYGTTQIGNHIFYNGNPVPPRDIPNAVASQLDVRPPAVTGYPSDLPPMLAAQRNLQPASVDDSFYRGIFAPPIRENGITTLRSEQQLARSFAPVVQEQPPAITGYPTDLPPMLAAQRNLQPSSVDSSFYNGIFNPVFSGVTANTPSVVPQSKNTPPLMRSDGQERGAPGVYSSKSTAPTIEQSAKPKAVALSRDSVPSTLKTSPVLGINSLPPIPPPSSPVGVQESNIQKQRAEQQLMRAGVPERVAVAAVNSPTQPNSIAKYQDQLAPSSIPMVGAAPVASAVPIAPVQTANVPLPRSRPTRAQSAPLMASIGQAAGRVGNAIAAPVKRAVAPIMASAAQSPAAQPLTSSSKIRYGAGEATDVTGMDMSQNPISIQNSERWLTGY